jgi:hypothetical protein
LYPGADSVVYVRDKYGFRGWYSSPSSIDILTIGGSTTDQRYITEGKTWQDRLAQRFLAEGRRISVVNAGVDGQSTFGHLKNFDWWFPSVPSLRAKIVLFYVGLNDFHVDDDRPYDQLVEPSSLIGFIREHSAFYWLARTLFGLHRAKVEGIGHKATKAEEVTWVTVGLVQDYEKLMHRRLLQYENRLKVLIQKARLAGMYPVFITQTSRAYKTGKEGLLGISAEFEYDGVRYNGVDSYYMMKMINQTTVRVAKENGAGVIDLAQEMQWEDDDFYDLSHNTPKGAGKIGEYLYKVLSTRFDSILTRSNNLNVQCAASTAP